MNMNEAFLGRCGHLGLCQALQPPCLGCHARPRQTLYQVLGVVPLLTDDAPTMPANQQSITVVRPT